MNNSEILNYLEKYNINRMITDIIIHCTASDENQKIGVAEIDIMHKNRGFSKQKESGHYCGYHFVVLQDGSIEIGRHLNEIGAHVQGQNSRSIGICYVGGIRDGKTADTRTVEQKESIVWLLIQLVSLFPNAKVKGHRDYSPDLNGNGIIEPWEFIKECPCFDAIKEYKHI